MRRLIPLVAVLVLASCGSGTTVDSTVAPASSAVTDDSVAAKEPAANGVTIDVTVGVDSGGDRVEEVALGSDVTINITNEDEDDEFHVHGYDISSGETDAGDTASISFTADKAGTFEVESHVTGELILTVVVK